jgi:Arc/MetJ family transcription regulator
MPYCAEMKMTLHIDDALLERVMTASGVASKTKAVDLALRELDRRAELKRLTAEGLGLSADELKEVYDPASTLAEPLPSPKPVRYGRKPRSGG